ncbi:unnamed protein product [Symbiodinium sp. CCMP2456]|nr:unnamed protein product [Symbiodinium sp. CCMP2456]
MGRRPTWHQKSAKGWASMQQKLTFGPSAFSPTSFSRAVYPLATSQQERL